jgi:gamma-glutamyltranspeptidase / glutathione hydrolase
MAVSSVCLAARPYTGGVVAAAHHLGAEAGKAMLDQGGNAVDAAVAAALTMAVVGPYHSGLGGGGFALIHDERGGDLALDFRETAPAAASREMFVRDGGFVQSLATDGPLSIATPGAVAGYLELHQRFGKLPRAVVFGPAIHAARQGFVVTPKYLTLALDRASCLERDPDAAAVFLRRAKDGGWQAPALGDKIKQPALARTLETLAKQGAKAFYGGPVGKALLADVSSKGALLTANDLRQYATVTRQPLEGSYRGHRILTMPPPSAGGVSLLQVLGVLEAHGPTGPHQREVESLHVFIEALRRSFAERSRVMGDPDFVVVPATALVSKPHIQAMHDAINVSRATKSAELAGTSSTAPLVPEKKNTTHISVVDAKGNAVALTSTINYYFGSCILSGSTGILLNDEMDDFAGQPGATNVFGLVQGGANGIVPKKRPISSMTPTLVFQKDNPTAIRLVVGSPGGSTIPTTVMQVISHVIDGQLDVVRAVGQGRIHHQFQPDSVMVDKVGLDPSTAKALEALGHTLKRVEGWGDAEAVAVDPTTSLRTAGSDPRNEGQPAGQP